MKTPSAGSQPRGGRRRSFPGGEGSEKLCSPWIQPERARSGRESAVVEFNSVGPPLLEPPAEEEDPEVEPPFDGLGAAKR